MIIFNPSQNFYLKKNIKIGTTYFVDWFAKFYRNIYSAPTQNIPTSLFCCGAFFLKFKPEVHFSLSDINLCRDDYNEASQNFSFTFQRTPRNLTPMCGKIQTTQKHWITSKRLNILRRLTAVRWFEGCIDELLESEHKCIATVLRIMASKAVASLRIYY